jgi:hypothetical protein
MEFRIGHEEEIALVCSAVIERHGIDLPPYTICFGSLYRTDDTLLSFLSKSGLFSKKPHAKESGPPKETGWSEAEFNAIVLECAEAFERYGIAVTKSATALEALRWSIFMTLEANGYKRPLFIWHTTDWYALVEKFTRGR